ncbi:hypothetical protein VNO78_26369 [Psophocarpus tetragonolobus]|uniref:DUF1639 family protein n=1 Tax=Psophocarpus tetragonolobus TaxID=3891 RepID=A0AAN9X8W6_PSOTE
MATAPAPPPAPPPVKSQPLHNFSLPFLKWGGSGKNQTNGSQQQRCRRGSDHGSEAESEPESRPQRVGSRSARNRLAVPPGSLKASSCLEETDDGVQKPWNLRPRKATLPKASLEIGTRSHPNNAADFHDLHPAPAPAPKSLRLRGFSDTHCSDKKEKRKFWIALSREEIEEDIFVMTGSRPSRRPHKRPKNVQKQIDSVFPGLWLVGITADAYRVSDTPAKR